MERLWAPWRIEYVRMKRRRGCIFCEAGKKEPGEFPLVAKTRYSIVLLNEYPYNPGHVMVAPARHVPDLLNLSDEELLDLFKTVKFMEKAVKKAFKPDGMNVGINLGKSAGAGITGHLHIHLVPRWEGDTNFMPVLSDTRIISQGLLDSFADLMKALSRDLRLGKTHKKDK